MSSRLFSAWPSFPWASLKLKQRQLPIQRLTLTFFMEATMEDLDLDIIMEASTVATLTTATTARDLLTLSLLLLLLLMPRPKLTPGMDTMDTDTVLDTDTDTVLDTTAPTDTVATLTTATTARDLLMLSLPLLLLLMPMPMLTPGTDTMDTDTVLDTATDLDTTVATTAMVAAMATTGASRIQSRADEDEVPTFLTTTCLMFSTSEKNQNVQNKTSSFFKHTAFKHLYILDFDIFACIPVTTFRTSRKNKKCVVLASDYIQRLRIKCRCLTNKSFNIKGNIVQKKK